MGLLDGRTNYFFNLTVDILFQRNIPYKPRAPLPQKKNTQPPCSHLPLKNAYNRKGFTLKSMGGKSGPKTCMLILPQKIYINKKAVW